MKGGYKPLVRITLDTNVLVSALLFGGTPQKVIDLVIADEAELHLSPFILSSFFIWIFQLEVERL